MATEIQITARLKATKGNLKFDRNVGTINADMAGDAVSGGAQDIPTTAAGTAVTIESSVATPGWAIFTNLDGTNYVEIGVQVAGTFYPLVKIPAGKTAGPFCLATGTFYARANTAQVSLLKEILEA